MRVMHLISSVYFFGAERVVAELSASLPQFGVTVYVGVLTVNKQLVEIFKDVVADADVTITEFDGQRTLNWSAIKAIGNHLIENEIDIVHCHGYKSNIYALLAQKFFRTKTCLVSTNHNWIGTTGREKIYQKIDALALRFYKGIVAVSADVKEQMLLAGIKNNKIVVIDNGINVQDNDFQTSSENARETLDLAPDDFVIGTIARLTPEKAHTDLLYAMEGLEDLSDLKLVFIGDGPEHDNIRTLIDALGLQKKVILAGNRDDARKLYAAFDVFALVSTNEGLPMVLLEALAAEVPIIATQVGAIPDVIHHGKNGLLVQPSQQSELMNAIRIFHTDAQLRMQFAMAGKEIVQQSFSSQYMAGEYCKQYEHCCTEGMR